MSSDVSECNALVIYIDIYGFSSLLEQSSTALNNKDLPINKKAIVIKLTHIWQDVSGIINSDYTNAYFFSDSLFLMYNMMQYNGTHFIRDVISDVSKIMDIYLDNALLVRGACAQGKVYFTGSLLIGDPVLDAVALEETVNPAPFTIIPLSAINNLIDSQGPFTQVKSYVIPTKSGTGIVDCIIILPNNIRKYRELVKYYSRHFMSMNIFDKAKFWHDTDVLLTKLINVEE